MTNIKCIYCRKYIKQFDTFYSINICDICLHDNDFYDVINDGDYDIFNNPLDSSFDKLKRSCYDIFRRIYCLH